MVVVIGDLQLSGAQPTVSRRIIVRFRKIRDIEEIWAKIGGRGILRCLYNVLNQRVNRFAWFPFLDIPLFNGRYLIKPRVHEISVRGQKPISPNHLEFYRNFTENTICMSRRNNRSRQWNKIIYDQTSVLPVVHNIKSFHKI